MTRPRVVVVGAGFAGPQSARRLTRLARGRAEVTLVKPTDYFLYAPVLPRQAVQTGLVTGAAVPLAAGAAPGLEAVAEPT